MSSIVGIIGNNSPNSYSKPIYTLQLPPFELVKQALNTDWDSPAPSAAIPALDVGSPHLKMGISEKPLCTGSYLQLNLLLYPPLILGGNPAGTCGFRGGIKSEECCRKICTSLLQHRREGGLLPKKPFRLPQPLSLKATASHRSSNRLC